METIKKSEESKWTTIARTMACCSSQNEEEVDDDDDDDYDGDVDNHVDVSIFPDLSLRQC